MVVTKRFQVIGVKSLTDFISIPPEIEKDIEGAMCPVVEVEHGLDKWLFMRGTGMMLDYYRLPVVFGFKYSAWKNLWNKNSVTAEQAEKAEQIVCIPEIYYTGDTFRNNLTIMLQPPEIGFEQADIEELYNAIRNLPAGTDIEVHWSDIYVRGRHIFQFTKEEGTAVDTLCRTLIEGEHNVYAIGRELVPEKEACIFDYYLVAEDTIRTILGDIGYVTEETVADVLSCAADYNIIKQEHGTVWYAFGEVANMLPSAVDYRIWALVGDEVRETLKELPKTRFVLISRDTLNTWADVFEAFEENKGIEFRNNRDGIQNFDSTSLE